MVESESRFVTVAAAVVVTPSDTIFKASYKAFIDWTEYKPLVLEKREASSNKESSTTEETRIEVCS